MKLIKTDNLSVNSKTKHKMKQGMKKQIHVTLIAL